MNAPRRLLDDPEADETLRQVLSGSGRARALDEVTRRRLRGKVARASALPVAAAGWIFVKSAAAALGVVGALATVATVTGVVEWRGSQTELARPARSAPVAPRPAPAQAAPTPEPVTPTAPSEPEPQLTKPAPTVPVAAPSGSSAGSLAAESALLEQARHELGRDAALALGLASEHARRFPRGQLAAERTLIQVEGLHRSGRDAEARVLGRGLLSGASGDLYRERARQLLGEVTP